MVKLFGFLSLMLVMVFPSGAEEAVGLHPVRLGKKFGFVNAEGKMVFPADLDWAWPFTEGRAGVRQGRDWFLVDDRGNRVCLS